MKILTKDSGHDPVQTQIDIVQRMIRFYSLYLDCWYEDISATGARAKLAQNLDKEVKNLEVLKSTHPEYFI